MKKNLCFKMRKLSAAVLSSAMLIGALPIAGFEPISVSAATIPSDAGSFGGHYYYVYEDATTWTQAKQLCEARGGHLAVFSSKEESDYAFNYMTQKGYNLAYFGLSDQDEEGVWKSVTGEDITFTNWHANEPSHSSDHEDYAMFYYRFSDGTWNDGTFTEKNKRPYICEWGDKEFPNPFSKPQDSITFGNYEYYIYEDASSWEIAKQMCEYRGGNLATITSQEENDFLFQYVKDKGYSNAYFGYSDNETEGTWKWVTDNDSTYTNFHPGEPNGQNANEDYAMFYTQFTDGTWNDGNFGSSPAGGGVAYICKWKVELKSQQISVSKKASKTITYSAKNLKNKQAVFTIGAKANTKLTYKVIKGNAKNIVVSSKGKVTLKKGCQKGTYKISVKAAETDDFLGTSKTITIKVK